MNNNKYYLNVIFSVTLVALLLILTLYYIKRIRIPYILVPVLLIDGLSVLYAYKTIKNKPTNKKNNNELNRN